MAAFISVDASHSNVVNSNQFSAPHETDVLYRLACVMDGDSKEEEGFGLDIWLWPSQLPLMLHEEFRPLRERTRNCPVLIDPSIWTERERALCINKTFEEIVTSVEDQLKMGYSSVVDSRLATSH